MFKLPYNKPDLFERFKGNRAKRRRLLKKARGLAGSTKHLMLSGQTYKVFRHTDAEGNRIKLHVWKDKLGERGVLKVSAPGKEEGELTYLIYIESGWLTDYTANLAPAELWMPDSVVDRYGTDKQFLGTLKVDEDDAMYWDSESFSQGMDSRSFPGTIRGTYLAGLPCTGTGPMKKLQQVMAGSTRNFDAAALVAFQEPTLYATTGFYRIPGTRKYRWVVLHVDDDMLSVYVQDASFVWPGSFIAALCDSYEAGGDIESASYLEGYLFATIAAPPEEDWVRASHEELRIYGNPIYYAWTWDDSGRKAYVSTQEVINRWDWGSYAGFRGYKARGHTLTVQDEGWDSHGAPLVTIDIAVEGPKTWAPGRLASFISVAHPGVDPIYGNAQIGTPTGFDYGDDTLPNEDGAIVYGWMGPAGEPVVHRVRNQLVRAAETEDHGGLREYEYFPYLEHVVPGSHSGSYKQNQALYKVGIYGPGYELSGNSGGAISEQTETVESVLTGSEFGGDVVCEWAEGSTGPCNDPCRTGKISNDGTFKGNHWVVKNPPSRTDLGGGNCYGYSKICWRVSQIDFARATKTKIGAIKGGDNSSAILLIPEFNSQSAFVAFQEQKVQQTNSTIVYTSEGVGKVVLDVVTTNTSGYIKPGYSNTALCRNGDLAYSSMLPSLGYNFGAFCFHPDTRIKIQSQDSQITDPSRSHKTVFIGAAGDVTTVHEEVLTGENGSSFSNSWYQLCLSPFYLDVFETQAILPPLFSIISAWSKEVVKNAPPPGSSSFDSEYLPPGAYASGGAWIGIV